MKPKDFDTEVLSPCQIIAWNLERARRSRGLTQDQAAEKLEPYLGYRLSRAAFSQAEHCLYGKRRRFDADEIVAFARVFELPVAYFFRPPQPHFQGKTVMVNGRPGNPKARVTSPPLTRQQMLMLAQGLPDGQIKTVRRGRPAWIPPDLARVEEAARRSQNMAQIARSLGIDVSTFHRKKQSSPEFNDAVEIGREKRAEELRLIQALAPQGRQEIGERARQRLRHPEVRATTQAVGHDAEMERLETLTARGSVDTDATPAGSAQESMRANASAAERHNAMLLKLSLSRQMGGVGEPALPRVFEQCPKCGRRPQAGEELSLNNGIVIWHSLCRYNGNKI